jgi:hypothetical protein
MKKLIALALCFVALCSVPAFAVVSATESDEATLGISEADFQSLFVDAMEQQEQSCTYEVVNRVEGKKYDYLTIALTQYCTGVFTVKDSEIVKILIVGSRDDAGTSDVEIACVIIAAVASIEPSIVISNALDVVLELAAKTTCSTEICTYELAASSTADVIFSAKPLETEE